MRQNYVKSDFTESWLEDGIIVQVLNSKLNEVNLTIAKQFVLDRQLASGGVIRPVLVIVQNVVNINKEANKYYEEEEPYKNISAIAMFIDNYVAKVIGNLVFKFKTQPVPIELFNNKEKAVKWLEKFKYV
jgi:hypothetical protein